MISLVQIQLASSLAGIASVQFRGSDIERVQLETTRHDREVDSVDLAVAAEGLGTATEDQATTDRDADGRRAWEPVGNEKESEADAGEPTSGDDRVLDPTDNRGQHFDAIV